MNSSIRATEVRVIDEKGENLGVMSTAQALAAAKEQGLDLVEVSPKAQPPVCRIIEFGKYKYEILKKQQKQKKKSKVSKLKGIRLSARISEHDLQMKAQNASKFLEEGNKIKVEVRMRGRENQHADLAFDLLKKFEQMVSFPIGFDQRPRRMGSTIVMIIFKQ